MHLACLWLSSLRKLQPTHSMVFHSHSCACRWRRGRWLQRSRQTQLCERRQTTGQRRRCSASPRGQARLQAAPTSGWATSRCACSKHAPPAVARGPVDARPRPVLPGRRACCRGRVPALSAPVSAGGGARCTLPAQPPGGASAGSRQQARQQQASQRPTAGGQGAGGQAAC